jgi:hypothetical protein
LILVWFSDFIICQILLAHTFHQGFVSFVWQAGEIKMNSIRLSSGNALKNRTGAEKTGFHIEMVDRFFLGKMYTAAHLALPFIWFRIGLDLAAP